VLLQKKYVIFIVAVRELLRRQPQFLMQFSRKKGIVFNMSNKKYNEMEEIQRGLEAFLNQELTGQEKEEEYREPKRERRAREPQLYELEDWDSPDYEERSRKSREEAERADAGSTRARSNAGRSAGREADERGNRNERSVRRESDARGTRERSSAGRSVRREVDGRSNRNERSVRRETDGRSARTGRSVRGEADGRSVRREADAGGNRTERKPRGRKKSRVKRVVLAVILVAALFFAGLYSLVGIVYNKLNYEEISSVAGLPMKEDGVVNILLIGNDSRTNGEDGRSDAMILLSISSRTKTIYMTSLLRDMYVEIPGHDGNRLNAAYSFGGAELLMETVEKNLGITINRCMQVNFEAFANLVDAVGGVDLELTQEEVVYVNGYLVEYNMLLDRPQGTDNLDTSVSGLIHLNGAQALAYCRNRYLGTDFGRTERQRKVLTAVIKKLPVTLLTNGSELFDGLMPNLTTNLTKNECFRLSLMAGKLITYDIVSDSIPQPDTYKDVTIRKMAVLEVDFETNKKYLREKLYGE
jgi:LCP family protein required for cell wall assembly